MVTEPHGQNNRHTSSRADGNGALDDERLAAYRAGLADASSVTEEGAMSYAGLDRLLTVLRDDLPELGEPGSWEHHRYFAGGFVNRMMDAIQRADRGNKERIRRAFPQLVAAHEMTDWRR